MAATLGVGDAVRDAAAPSRLYRVYYLHENSYLAPDEMLDRVTRRASDLGMSRSEFFARAAQRYLDELDAQSLTGQSDSALARLRGTDEAEAAAMAIGHRVLDAVDDAW